MTLSGILSPSLQVVHERAGVGVEGETGNTYESDGSKTPSNRSPPTQPKSHVRDSQFKLSLL